MPNNCEKCGAPVRDGSKFCTSCGAKISASPVLPEDEINQANNMPNINKYPNESYQNNSMPPAPQKKSNIKLIGIVLTVVVAVVIILAAVLVFFGGGGLGSDEGKFIGTWEYSIMGMSVQYKFNSDKTLEVGSMGFMSEAGTWKLSDGKLVISVDAGMGSTATAGTFEYKFSNNDNTLTLSTNGAEVMSFQKK